MSTVPGLIRDTLVWMMQNHQKAWRANLKSDLWYVYDQINLRYPPITEPGELASRLPGNKRMTATLAKEGRYIYLNPLEKGIFALPVLTLTCNLNDDSASYYVALFIRRPGASKLKSLGFRFETPYKKGDDGRHSSHHIQFIKGFEKGVPLVGAPSWIPDREPTFPLIARDPLELLLSVLISLYGWTYLAQLQKTSFNKDIAPYIQRMRGARTINH